MSHPAQNSPAQNSPAEVAASPVNEAPEVMPAPMHTSQWQSFQLLPGSFACRRNSHRVLYVWAAINFCLLASLCSLTTAFWVQGKQAKSKRSDLVRAAYPLIEIRRSCERMNRDTKLQNQWIDTVESAKPDDSALQTLLAIADATAATENAIDVNSIEVKLQLEHAFDGQLTPEWAKQRLLITADVQNGSTADHWHKRIDGSDRVSRASLRTPNGNWANRTVQIIGDPVSTKVLP